MVSVACSKSQRESRPFFKQKRDLVEEQSQQQSANIPLVFFAGREKGFPFVTGKG